MKNKIKEKLDVWIGNLLEGIGTVIGVVIGIVFVAITTVMSICIGLIGGDVNNYVFEREQKLDRFCRKLDEFADKFQD